MRIDGGEPPEAVLGQVGQLGSWMGLCEVVGRVRVLINRDLQVGVGLTRADNLVLCQVAMAPGRRLRMVEISDGLRVAKSAVTKTVDRLEQRGLFVRERDPGDRRTVYGAVSPAGSEVLAPARPAFVEAVELHFAGRSTGPRSTSSSTCRHSSHGQRPDSTGDRDDLAGPTVRDATECRRIAGGPPQLEEQAGEISRLKPLMPIGRDKTSEQAASELTA